MFIARASRIALKLRATRLPGQLPVDEGRCPPGHDL